MLTQRLITLSLLLIFLVEASAELVLVWSENLRISETWFPLVLLIIGSAALFLGRGQRSTPVLCLLLASMAVLVSRVDPTEFTSIEWTQRFGEVSGASLGFFWSALRWLVGFAFVHFAFIFPVEERFLRHRPGRVFLVYLPYILLLGLEPLLGAEKGLGPLSLLLCLPVGVAILFRKYRISMTPAEKNRLRVVLIGCLAGALPAALATLSMVRMEDKAGRVQDLGLFMFPLFPLGLVGAVLAENFSEIGKSLQRMLTYSLAASGAVTAFFLCYWMISPILGDASGRAVDPRVLSATLAVLLTFPLLHWSGSYISAHFNARDESEPVAEAGELPFRPIEPNPYIVGNPIRSPEMFFGREEDFQFIRAKLCGERHGCVIVLYGERRTGKTSILYQILNGRLGPDFLPVFLDMQGMVVQRDGEFLDGLAAKIRDVITIHCGSKGVTLPAAVDSYLDFSHFMDSASGMTDNRRLVLLIDEYELIETKVKDAKLGAEIFGYFNSLLLRYPRLSFVFTGSKDLAVSGAWTTLLERSIYRKISFLARKDAEELVRNPLQDKALFTSGMVNDLLRLTHGHPFFTQAVCQTLVEVLNELQSNIVSRNALDETVRRMLENPPPQLFYQWKIFSDPEKLVLSALATLLKKPQGYQSSDRVEKLLRSLPREYPHQLDAPIIRMHFESLRDGSVLDRDQAGYRFTMDLMRLWVQSEHNVWKVLSEVRPGSGQKTVPAK
ncbi:MAG TPA: hypothetical protein VE398_18905 [Acidobacteriota bacterium]|nr:hypothetical protein [Acidobacteriota bacterium]